MARHNQSFTKHQPAYTFGSQLATIEEAKNSESYKDLEPIRAKSPSDSPKYNFVDSEASDDHEVGNKQPEIEGIFGKQEPSSGDHSSMH
jgi:hypothetical protein